VSALSSRVKNIYPYENSSEESVSAVFTAASEEQIQSAATENSENVQQSISTERTYTVQKGDTISKISRRLFQTKEYVDAIMEENGLTESDSIYPGQKLKIPSVKVQ
jgi:LysM repeat protein